MEDTQIEQNDEVGMDVFFLPHHHTSYIQQQEGVQGESRWFHMHRLVVLEMSPSFVGMAVAVGQFYHHHIHRTWYQRG